MDKTKNPGSYDNPTTKNLEENNMPETRTNIDDFLTVRGFGGGGGWGGGGYGFGGNGGRDSFAGPSANAVRINANARQIEGQSDCTRRILGSEIRGVNSSLENLERNSQFSNLKDQLSTQGRDLKDFELSAVAQNKADAIEALKCCCAGQLTASENKAEILTGQKDIIIEGLRRDLATAVDKNNITATASAVNSNTNADTNLILQAIGNLAQAISNQGHHGHHDRP